MLDDESLKKVRQIVADITQKKIAEAKSESLAISKGDSFD